MPSEHLCPGSDGGSAAADTAGPTASPTELRTMRDRSVPCGTASALQNGNVFKLTATECRRALRGCYRNRERERKRQKNDSADEGKETESKKDNLPG